MKKTKILLLAAPVPEQSKYMVSGVGGAWNLALHGIAEGMRAAAEGDVETKGFWGIRSWPRVRQLFVGKQLVHFPSGLLVTLLPDFNMLGVRDISRFFVTFVTVLLWGIRHLASRKVVVTYNYASPPLWPVLLAAFIIRAKVVPIIFDIGDSLTPSQSMVSKARTILELILRTAVRHVSGACVITKQIQERFVPTKTALLVDGGVSPSILDRLFDLHRDAVTSDRKEVVFLLAGSLFEYNGVYLAIEAMKLVKDSSVRLIVAGQGNEACEQAVKDAAMKDSRIEFVGQQTLDDLFALYKDADVFLNLRITEKIDTSCFFPSKFIEALVVGRYVISTNVAHLKDMYGDYCRVLYDERPQTLAQAMIEATHISREYRDKIGAKARQFMLNSHTWNHQMARVYHYCNNLVAGDYDGCKGMVEV